MSSPKYSIIVPVYNRPQELDALLQSLTLQTFRDFDVLIIEDGSSVKSDGVFEKYAPVLPLQYFFKPNTGPGPSRNFGFEKAQGKYFVVFDSDCIIPPHYFEAVENALGASPFDAWGGPDRGHGNFTPLQQAMAYTMSSVLTTGGIRGAKAKNFQPRSFNMGFSLEVFKLTGGFHFDRLAEDIELSIRMRKMGLVVVLIPDAFVYHQRRSTLSAFFKQVTGFAKGRVLVGRAHPGEVKLTHWFPALFLLGLIGLPFLFFIHFALAIFGIACYIGYFTAIGVAALAKTGSAQVALLSIPAALVQLVGYGWGFLKEISRFITR